MNLWRNINHTPAPIGKKVLVIVGKRVGIAKYTPGHEHGDWSVYHGCGSITHWMYLPELPAGIQ